MFRYGFAYLAIALAFCVDLSNHAALSERELKKYQQLIEGQGLYTPEDDITILTESNFKDLIYGKKHATIVEFYNSWCGFCQRFAPSWKALATDIKGWKHMIDVAAIDCNDPDNSNVCRNFDIGAYPTLRYIPEHYQEGPNNIGTDVPKGEDFYTHKLYLVKQMIQEQKEERGKPFPNLLPYTYPDINHLFDDVPSGTKYVFLVLEQQDALTGPEIALDFEQVPNVVVKYSPHNNTLLLNSLRVPKLPSMLVVGSDKFQQLFTDGLGTRESTRMVIKEFLRPKMIDVPEVTTLKGIFTGKWIDAEIPDMAELMEARERESLKQKIKKMGDVVFQADLETALRNSLKREVALHKTISGEPLEALVNYLKVLVKYFPFGRRGQEFLVDLKDKVVAAGQTVKGADIERWVTDAEQEDRKVFSSPSQWLACRGSSVTYRGFPCGLWKMFHFLTVAAAEQNVGDENAYPREILDAMHGYIKNFFGCSDCSKHFQQMAVEKDMKSVGSLDSAVLWLWMAHNTVNKRLSGDATEDPEFPKIQFPLPERCSACRNGDGTWNYPEVLQYIKYVYSSINVRYIGSDTRILHMGLEGSTGSNGSATHAFKKIDASMCFILYVGSFCLIVILIRMFLKRGYKKKMYVHDLLGKV